MLSVAIFSIANLIDQFGRVGQSLCFFV